MKTNLKTLLVSVLIFGVAALCGSCAVIPERASAVNNFEVKKYLGTWYEIARFDFVFERGLNNTSAHYRLDKDGNVVVLNSGYKPESKRWKKATGLAKFRGSKSLAALKVSFFGPFYAGYNVVAIDPNYTYALVLGKSLDYIWILSRKKSIPETIKTKYLALAKEIGYDTSKLIWVKHDRNDNPYISNEK